MESEQQEKKKDEPKTKTETTKAEDDGNKPESSDLITQTNKAAERLEAANKIQAEQLKQQQELYTRMKLGGETGISPAEKPEVITDKEYAEKVLKGEVDPLKDDGFK